MGIQVYLFLLFNSVLVANAQDYFRQHTIHFEVLETGCQAKGWIEMINLNGLPFTLHLNNENHQITSVWNNSYHIDDTTFDKGSIIYALNDTLRFNFEIMDCENGNEIYKVGKLKYELSNKLFRKELYAMSSKVIEIFEEYQIDDTTIIEHLNFDVQLPRNATFLKATSNFKKNIEVNQELNTVTFSAKLDGTEPFDYTLRYEIHPVKERIIKVKLKGPVTSIRMWDSVKEDHDIIDMYINDVLVLRHHTALNQKETVPLPVERVKRVKVMNVSEGGIPPNTILLEFSDGENTEILNVITDEDTYTVLVFDYE